MRPRVGGYAERMISSTLDPSALTSDLAAGGASIADRVTDAVVTQAAELATDIAIPAAKFAAANFVRTRARSIAFGLVLVLVVPVIVKRIRNRDRDRDEGGEAVISTIPTMETRR